MQQGIPPGPAGRGRPPGPTVGGMVPPSPDGAGPLITRDMRGLPDDDERMWALFAHGAGMLMPVFGPLGVWFMKQEESEFVAYHAAQAVYWGLITVIGSMLIVVFTCGAGGFVCPAFWLVAAYVGLQAKEGSWTGYWFIHPYGYGRKLF
jgi:hypothetical protein